MSPQPKRDDGWTCSGCSSWNESSRTRCRNCQTGTAGLTPFAFPATGQLVRSVLVDGEPRFVGKDVAMILGHSNPSRAVRDHVPAGHRWVTESVTRSGLGLDPQTVLIDEAGLYRLIMRSNTALADQFQEWVTAEVLPTIRRTGSYAVPPALGDPLAELERQTNLTAQAISIAKAERERADALEPDALRARRTMDAHGMSLVGTVAKRFGIKERALREFLFAEQLLIRNGSRRNEPYARFIETGHFELKTRLVDVHPDRAPEERSTTYVTPKGEALIWRRLHAAGLVSSPTMPGEQLAIAGGA